MHLRWVASMSIMLGIFIFCGQRTDAHKIYLLDGRIIEAENVFEEHNALIDDVSLYGYKKAGIPPDVCAKLAPLS